jgi:hypothetical protein
MNSSLHTLSTAYGVQTSGRVDDIEDLADG